MDDVSYSPTRTSDLQSVALITSSRVLISLFLFSGTRSDQRILFGGGDGDVACCCCIAAQTWLLPGFSCLLSSDRLFNTY
ncbi:hypothetical protein BDQ94DRAFT_154015 [Aspergillus welwitschiae]|uniref:Uncharacterized protein n=1 Tax=Aspergillus welwitschiae TaxID=1341132 RepID=A0A3F3PK70_9EURO|nr:hypothetical protein BDQ94DRAFT_154015 [Aspergillus welwitschiae]RDH27350.1 hypothetical protein BDQ94DRAFT_154015 [Aspergillus welwitschiae]